MARSLVCLGLVIAMACTARPLLAQGACALLSSADIGKAAGLTVGSGDAGKTVPGTLGKCTWLGGNNTRVIVTLADARHMQVVVEAQQETGGTALPGIGNKAVGIKGAAFTGGGYIVSVLDSKGGFGLSILGPSGNQQRAVALAKLVESRR
ncbi:MAG: hypothetical protein KGL37_06430 [Acidobacteriota bacterium]|nr:hypothetical protein [Acidobacteriota bacterium]